MRILVFYVQLALVLVPVYLLSLMLYLLHTIHDIIITWLMMVWKRCRVLTTEIFLSWAWFGGPDIWTASLPVATISSHFMLNSRMALSTFLEMMVAKGPLPPAVASSLCVCVCVCVCVYKGDDSKESFPFFYLSRNELAWSWLIHSYVQVIHTTILIDSI